MGKEWVGEAAAAAAAKNVLVGMFLSEYQPEIMPKAPKSKFKEEVCRICMLLSLPILILHPPPPEILCSTLLKRGRRRRRR
jgi:hypothetical protein